MSDLTILHTFTYYHLSKGKLGPLTFSFRSPAQDLGALGYWVPTSLFSQWKMTDVKMDSGDTIGTLLNHNRWGITNMQTLNDKITQGLHAGIQ